MTRNTNYKPDALSREIRRQFGNYATTRYTRSLPGFAIDTKLPDSLQRLLDALDTVEAPPASGRKHS